MRFEQEARLRAGASGAGGFDIVAAYHQHNAQHPSTNVNNRHARDLFGGNSISAVTTGANPQTLLDFNCVAAARTHGGTHDYLADSGL